MECRTSAFMMFALATLVAVPGAVADHATGPQSQHGCVEFTEEGGVDVDRDPETGSIDIYVGVNGTGVRITPTCLL